VEVVTMALAAGPRTTPAHRLTGWAWVAVVLTPLGWGAAAMAAAGVARVVSAGLYVLSLVLVPLLITSFSVPWLIAVFGAELVLWLEWQRGGSDLPGAAGGPGSASGGAG
jgi:hypothetical protein